MACGASTWSGNAFTDSYDSSIGSYAETRLNTQGDVSVNGGSTLSGYAKINGQLFTVHPTVGNCSQGNGITLSGSAKVTGGYAGLMPVSFPAPGPFTAGTLDVTLSGSNQATLSPGSYRNITVSGSGILTVHPGVYNINSISLSGSAKLVISPTGPIVFNVAGSGSARPVSLISGNGVGSPLGTPRNFLINYGGTGQLDLSGTGATYGVVYAPNAAATVSGSGGWFGSMVVYTLTVSGYGAIHYDRSLCR
jgi:hypothetical protein